MNNPQAQAKEHLGGAAFPSSSSALATNAAPQPMEGFHDLGPPPFLTKTYEIVDDPATNHIVSWSKGNNSFVVWDAQAFAMSLLPKYFKHNNFSSFIRQLNTYDPREEVFQAWYIDDSDADQRLPHHRQPKEFVSLEQLAALGVLNWGFDVDNHETDEELKKIRKERGYSYMDFCEVSPEKLPNYEEMLKSFFREHLHADEEIRYCLAGSGYFDLRDQDDAWIRVWVKKGGMIVFAAGIYHRFTLDSDNYIKAMRMFAGSPIWTPYYRPQEHLPARKAYLEAFGRKKAGHRARDAAPGNEA